MRVFTSGVKVVDGLFGARFCLLAVCVFVCSIDRSYSSDTNKQTPGPVDPRNLTTLQRNSAVTIEFDFTHIAKENRAAALDAAKREARRKILEYLNRRKRSTVSTYLTTAVPSTTPVATVAVTTAATITTNPTTLETTQAALTTVPTTSAVETTTQTPTTVAATTVTEPPTTVTEPPTTVTEPPTTVTEPPTTIVTYTPTQLIPTTTTDIPPNRRRRESGEKNAERNDTFTEDNVRFVINDPEIDEDGIFRFSIFIDNETSTLGDLSHLDLAGLDLADLDLGRLLLETALAVNETGELETAANAPVVKISRGLPDRSDPTIRPMIMDAALAGFRVWLPILLAIIILLIVFIIVCCWKAKQKKAKDVEQQKIVPKQDSKPSTSNGHAHPRILDDNSGWLVPYEQFGSEQKI